MKGNEGRPNKPIYKKWWFWVIAIIIVGGIGGALDGDKETAAPTNTETSAPADELGGVPEETADATSEPAAPAEEPAEETPVEETAAEEPAKEEPVSDPAADPTATGDWEAEIEKIASNSDAAPDKASAVEALAMDYKPSDDELKEFESYIVSEFKSGTYLTGLSDNTYALTNIFQALTVQQQYKNLNESAIGDFAFDFYQNSKYVYRGVDAPDSDAVKSNEEQMEKSLAKM